MTNPFIQDGVTLYHGDCMDILPTLPAESVHCCVTSPPYWGLRDYGVDGQLGFETTPTEFIENMVDVFREVRRVLRDDGTLWLNLGDSYFSTQNSNRNGLTESLAGAVRGGGEYKTQKRSAGSLPIKPKDLCGIPWRVAFALQQPYYSGRIKNIHDRIWLAAMVDAEGCIFIHKRKAGRDNGQGYKAKKDSYGSGLEVSNTNRRIPELCQSITGQGSICEQASGKFGRKQTLYRWNLRSNECRQVLQEIYPHLVAKQHEARLAIGCPVDGAKAVEAHASLKGLHQGNVAAIDFDAPPSMFEKGYYLRQDIIWSKLNPMPESVTDRCTKAHEYIFLLSKKARYYYNAQAIAEATDPQWSARYKSKMFAGDKESSGVGRPGGAANTEATWTEKPTRNRRSVWTVAVKSYSGAHFATFPPKLIEPCILAGCPEGGTVLDPFMGSGTTAAVAQRNGCRSIGCELNEEYLELAIKRFRQRSLFA